jgi:hypothetical protein
MFHEAVMGFNPWVTFFGKKLDDIALFDHSRL